MPTPDASQYTFIHKLQTTQECEKYIDPKKLRVARQYVTRPIGFDTLFERNALKSNTSLEWIVSTFAGSGDYAQFNAPYGVAVDSFGNVYVGDAANHRIRKITPAGVVSTLAGGLSGGYQDGAGDSARFSVPTGVAVDSSGNVYVADTGNERIRKITPAGVVSTLAGGVVGYEDGAGDSAKFDTPFGVAVDSSGNVYVADTDNNRIRKITASTGIVSTLAGDSTSGNNDGTGTSARFFSPAGIAVDSLGNVYVSDRGNNSIRKITASTGIVSTLAGDGTTGNNDGTGTSARFFSPIGIAVDSSENVYVADKYNNSIRKITASTGIVSTLAGGVLGYQDGPAADAKFKNPNGVAVDSSGNVYVSDTDSNRIRKITYS